MGLKGSGSRREAALLIDSVPLPSAGMIQIRFQGSEA